MYVLLWNQEDARQCLNISTASQKPETTAKLEASWVTKLSERFCRSTTECHPDIVPKSQYLHIYVHMYVAWYRHTYVEPMIPPKVSYSN
jgi:G:T-mismatch repair DNA endonuclease (very short patch repair protein)